ncbi:MAG: gliding motility-associated C-terminal domain-containing protein [Chitinophagaceae bacterium]|nr:gliding motility-associated C-terminal domain-containing protein [Chitinophagaceae bacterium]
MKKICLVVLSQVFLLQLRAQLCTGSLGDPVVHITFGNDNTPNGPLKAGVTNMTYVTGCPNDGSYTITNLSFGCFSNTWHLLAGDHTGDVGGRYMLINASLEPSDFYVDTVSGLCGNTVYEFATWAGNVLRPSACNGAGIKPNLTFRIETVTGTILQEFSSGDIPNSSAKEWHQYGTFFVTPATAATVVLRIRNNSKGGCGNDLMLDDITFRPCGPKVSAYADNDTTGYIDVCENDQKDFHFAASYSAGFTDPVLQWQISKDSGKTWADIAGEQGTGFTRKPTKAGLYKYRVSIAERANFASTSCRIASNITAITVNPAPSLPTFNPVLGCTGTPTRMDAPEGSDYTYQWTGPHQFSSTQPSVVIPSTQYSDSGLYRIVISVLGCVQTDTFYLHVAPGAKATVGAGGSICEGTGITLSASGGAGYAWTPVAGLSDAHIANPFASPVDTTVYKVVVTNQYGCKDSAQVILNVWKKPTVNAGPDQRIFEDESTSLHGSVGGTSVDYSWTPVVYMTNSNSLTPVVRPPDNFTYTLTGTSELGCGVATDDVVIKVYKKIKPPNAFSPNGDGVNDTWVISGLDTYPESLVRVFDRGGHIVFQSVSTEKIWDGTYKGKPVPVATYYYTINPGTGQPAMSGWVLVIR